MRRGSYTVSNAVGPDRTVEGWITRCGRFGVRNLGRCWSLDWLHNGYRITTTQTRREAVEIAALLAPVMPQAEADPDRAADIMRPVMRAITTERKRGTS